MDVPYLIRNPSHDHLFWAEDGLTRHNPEKAIFGRQPEEIYFWMQRSPTVCPAGMQKRLERAAPMRKEERMRRPLVNTIVLVSPIALLGVKQVVIDIPRNSGLT
jgi:hypothetical protein